MPWENKSVEELRKEFVIAAKSCTNFSALCREFNITRVTGKKWVERYEQGGSLSDQSRAPHNIANRTTDCFNENG